MKIRNHFQIVGKLWLNQWQEEGGNTVLWYTTALKAISLHRGANQIC